MEIQYSVQGYFGTLSPPRFYSFMKSLANRAISWQNNHLVLLDQRKLPNEVQFIECAVVQEAVAAITDMVVRGALLLPGLLPHMAWCLQREMLTNNHQILGRKE